MNAHGVGLGSILFLVLGCAGGGVTAPPTEQAHEATILASGVCTVTNGERGGSFTYADGHLVKVDARSETTHLEWEGDQLAEIVEIRGPEVVSRRHFEYRSDGRLIWEEEREGSGFELTARRSFAYNEEGWLVGMVEEDAERAVERCSWAYQDDRPALITCWHPGFTSVITLRYDDLGRNVAAETADTVAAERPNSTDTYAYTPEGVYAGLTTTDAGGEVILSRQEERDEDDRVRRIVYTSARHVAVLTLQYDGVFPPGFACGGPIEPPPGYPSLRAAPWLDSLSL